jgi:NAD(P)-dependent dehydrogenase (short-subunit alcohol dehydrogenase family)
MNYNPMDLSGRRYLVTGAASGLGRATALLLDRLNAELVLADRDGPGLEQSASQLSRKAAVSVFDFNETGQVKEWLNKLATENGKLNGFVHFAGISYISPLKAVSESKYQAVMRVNTYAALELAKAFTHKDCYAGDNGSIVLISSVYGFVGTAANVGYAMSKSALHGITKALAMELAARKIRVNCIAPGFVKTRMAESNTQLFADDYEATVAKLHPLGLGEPDDIANMTAFLFSDAARWITGSIMNVDGGFTAQ